MAFFTSKRISQSSRTFMDVKAKLTSLARSAGVVLYLTTYQSADVAQNSFSLLHTYRFALKAPWTLCFEFAEEVPHLKRSFSWFIYEEITKQILQYARNNFSRRACLKMAPISQQFMQQRHQLLYLQLRICTSTPRLITQPYIWNVLLLWGP